MADKDIVRLSVRLNLKNEQHAQIYKVLAGLDKDVHKSENQFIINAIDFYIQSFEDDDIIDQLRKKDKPVYVTSDDLKDVRREIESSMKDELIRLLGSAMMGGQATRGAAGRVESMQCGEAEEDNSFAAEAANRWG